MGSGRADAYLPIDRRVALAAGTDLPTTVWGTALEADLSGFTALTDALSKALGEQRGAEELTRRLNSLYDGLLRQVHRFGGTVLGFSGDAFTCWLDGDDGWRGAACARSLQRWMDAQGAAVPSGGAGHGAGVTGDLPPMRMKVALATGRTRRFLVGDPSVQLLEGLAGALVDELAEAERSASPGEVVLAPSTRRSLAGRVEISPRGVLTGLLGDPPAMAAIAPAHDGLSLDAVRPWLLPAVFARLAAGEEDFLAELRPVTAMFVRFSGIGFETDARAVEKLDRFVRSVQAVLCEYEGTLVQLTIGDKGSYLYAAFGAPLAHEDDPARALLAALALRARVRRRVLVDSVSVGVAAGRLRSGAYGGSERRTYGVLGDAVNLAARLMQAALPGQIIATADVRQATPRRFRWSGLPDLTVKGKGQLVAVALLRGRRSAGPGARRGDAGSQGMMLGRHAELATLCSCLEASAGGTGRIAAVIAEAGLGKTRLVQEFLRRAGPGRAVVVQGECPSFGVSGSYVVWRPVLSSLLGLPQGGPSRLRTAALASVLERMGPTVAARLPLLGPLFGLSIPDNQLTGGLDGRVRKLALEATVAEALRQVADRPMVVVLEDCHWMDPLSEDLLEVLGRAVIDLPVLVVLTLRPRGEAEGGELAVAQQSHFVPIPLGPLPPEAIEELIAVRVRQVTMAKAAAESLAELVQRAEGNPFYAEELLDYVLGVGAEGLDPARLAELPSSLQSLVLSRIDQLEERPRSALKVASAVGRVFAADVLAPVHHGLGADADVRRHLDVLCRSDFTVREDLDGATYSFKHAITQEAAYSTIESDTRAVLHGRIGRVLEDRSGDDIEGQLDLLAFHFGRSDEVDRRRRYVRRAGELAQARYASRAAIEYYRNVLPLLVGAERGEVLLNLGRTLVLAGRWDEAAGVFDEALREAVLDDDVRAQGWAETEQGELLRKQGRYGDALHRFERARAQFEGAGDHAGVAEVLHLEGTLAAQEGDLGRARARYRESLESRTRRGDRRGMARSLNGLGVVAEYEGDLAEAAAQYQQALAILTELGDTWGIAALTNNSGMTLLLRDRPAEARPLFERAVALQREIGDPHMLANFLSNLGDAARELGDGEDARRCYRESLGLAWELGEQWLIAYLLEDVAMLAAEGGHGAQAILLAAAAAQLREEIGTPLPPESAKKLEARVAQAWFEVAGAEGRQAAAAGAALPLDAAVEQAMGALDRQPAGRDVAAVDIRDEPLADAPAGER